MSAGDECLPVFGENRPGEESIIYLSVSTRASEESKRVKHCMSTFNISYDVFAFYLSALLPNIAQFLECQSIHH